LKLKAIAIALFILAATGTAHAQSGGMKGMDMKDMPKALTLKAMVIAGKDRKVDFEFRQEGKDYVITAVK
jgi:hypothetical protein